jgi:PPOX class probable F420-dependent enzyme
MSGKTTATSENALTKQEIDARLAHATVARIATTCADGATHLTPVWFLWDGKRFTLSFGASRLHVRNLRREPRISLVVDDDPRPVAGLEAGAWAISVRGRAELSDDGELITRTALALMTKALGAEAVRTPQTADYLRQAKAEGRVIATVTPERWLTWDYNKAA